MSRTTGKFSPEVRERAVRLVLDGEAARATGAGASASGRHASRRQSVLSISARIGCAPQTLNDWVRKAGVDSGKRAGVSGEMAEKMKALERGNRALLPGPTGSCARPARRSPPLNRWRDVIDFAMAEQGRRHRT